MRALAATRALASVAAIGLALPWLEACALDTAGAAATEPPEAGVARMDSSPPQDATTSRDATTEAEVGTIHAEAAPEASIPDAAPRDTAEAAPPDAGHDTSHGDEPACTTNCETGAPCTANSVCASGYCSGGVCQTTRSCEALAQANSLAISGRYVIQPAGSSEFAAFCDMSDQGGGWTLVLKMGTAPSVGTFSYTSTLWTNTTLLNHDSTDMSQTEAKFASYLTVPFQNILAMMSTVGSTTWPSGSNMLIIPLADSSLFHMIVNTSPNAADGGTHLGTSAWESLTTPAAVIQPDCNSEGINREPGTADNAHVRIGVLGNESDDCDTPDSYVGFGGSYDPAGRCDPESFSAGAMEGVGCSGGTMNIQSFGYLFVR